ncbi:hypothetical protein GGTG_13252 [Gaeumannomyces tritici R3-111a-1]|uniref:Uncharacterized protein n=1 Tax=Gaeumannomyces tritici (strain R3-111a-1) TaxID=644352 RepID=J3PIC4_GAET3|nr:hypothetical protein GGTG_13252 [Gaeumannomyces tritici R3-111a-1]EJT69143.1 hypothetical protein GGTG_13252 [Gaeumannomyces tritici R3-111a-1]
MAMRDCGSVGDLFDGDEAGAIPEYAAPGQAQASRLRLKTLESASSTVRRMGSRR